MTGKEHVIAGIQNRQDTLARLWRWLCFGVLVCLLVPLRYTLLKVGFVAGGVALWGLTLALYKDRRWVQITCTLIAVVSLAFVIFLILPGRPYDVNALRGQYVRSLLAYQGTYYIWGGGNRFGIDCSGLVERGLIDACFVRAAKTLNPRLAQEGLSLWWYNRSARALGDGYRGDTYLLRETPSLNTLDYATIEPGDLAVMADGVHVLAYVGDKTWIEADPEPMRVILAHVPRSTDYYFNSRGRLMRWRTLTDMPEASQ